MYVLPYLIPAILHKISNSFSKFLNHCIYRDEYLKVLISVHQVSFLNAFGVWDSGGLYCFNYFLLVDENRLIFHILMTKLVSISYNCLPPHDQDKNKLVLKAFLLFRHQRYAQHFLKKKKNARMLYKRTMMNKFGSLFVNKMQKNKHVYYIMRIFSHKSNINRMQCTSARVFYHAKMDLWVQCFFAIYLSIRRFLIFCKQCHETNEQSIT